MKILIRTALNYYLNVICLFCSWQLYKILSPHHHLGCSSLSSCCPDVWQCLADLCNVLARVDHEEVPLYKVETDESEGDEELTVLQLKEDRLLAGFVPLLAAPQEPCYTDKHTDMVSGQCFISFSSAVLMQSHSSSFTFRVFDFTSCSSCSHAFTLSSSLLRQ